jgi:uncharacterized metal-binding protein
MAKLVYSDDDRKIMMITQASMNRSRLQELINFIRLSGYKKIGIANCLSKQKEAEKLKLLLEKYDLDVFAINCKESGLQASDIDASMCGACCDPLSQAEYLNEQNTEFNIIVGLCLGHGLLFEKYSKVPVTTILVKGSIEDIT